LPDFFWADDFGFDLAFLALTMVELLLLSYLTGGMFVSPTASLFMFEKSGQ
jgi:hypothetical protein